MKKNFNFKKMLKMTLKFYVNVKKLLKKINYTKNRLK